MSEPLPEWNRSLPGPGTVMSTSEYLRTPETTRVQELWEGVVRVAESPTAWHQDLAFEIAVALRAHVRAHDLGKVWVAPLDVILDGDRALILQPDIVYVSEDRLDIVTDKVRGAPDLVVEVLSPLPRVGSIAERVACFAAYGVQECWLVNQIDRTVEVLHFEGGRVADRTTVSASSVIPSRVLPGLAFRLSDAIGWNAGLGPQRASN
jgi:Uma2 family endonuclease